MKHLFRKLFISTILSVFIFTNTGLATITVEASTYVSSLVGDYEAYDPSRYTGTLKEGAVVWRPAMEICVYKIPASSIDVDPSFIGTDEYWDQWTLSLEEKIQDKALNLNSIGRDTFTSSDSVCVLCQKNIYVNGYNVGSRSNYITSGFCGATDELRSLLYRTWQGTKSDWDVYDTITVLESLSKLSKSSYANNYSSYLYDLRSQLDLIEDRKCDNYYAVIFEPLCVRTVYSKLDGDYVHQVSYNTLSTDNRVDINKLRLFNIQGSRKGYYSGATDKNFVAGLIYHWARVNNIKRLDTSTLPEFWVSGASFGALMYKYAGSESSKLCSAVSASGVLASSSGADNPSLAQLGRIESALSSYSTGNIHRGAKDRHYWYSINSGRTGTIYSRGSLLFRGIGYWCYALTETKPTRDPVPPTTEEDSTIEPAPENSIPIEFEYSYWALPKDCSYDLSTYETSDENLIVNYFVEASTEDENFLSLLETLNANGDAYLNVTFKVNSDNDSPTTPNNTNMGGYTLTNPGGRLEDIPGYVNLIPNATRDEFTVKLRASAILRWFNGDWSPTVGYWIPVSDTTVDGDNYELLHVADIDVTIDFALSGASYYGAGTVDVDATHPGWGDYGVGTNWGNFIYNASDIDRVPWYWNSSEDLDVYAEVVANEVGGYTNISNADYLLSDRFLSDWNVFGGLPSTENLSVAVGGESFAVDANGYWTIEGTSYGSDVATANTGNGTNLGGVVQRKINFNVTVKDLWGSTVNTPCTLTCPGHSATITGSISVTGLTTIKGSATQASKTFECDACNATVTATYTPGTDEDEDEDGNTIPATEGSWSYGSHSCSATVTFDCATGTYTTTSSMTGTPTITLNAGSMQNGQNYSSGTVTITSPKGKTATTGAAGNGLRCEGYTTGHGCSHNNQINCVHRTEATRTYTIVETLDCYGYREIINAKVYALAYAEITDVNRDVVEDSAIGKTASNTNLYVMYSRLNNDGNSTWSNSDTSNQMGRLFFTRFVSPTAGSNMYSVTCTGYDLDGNATNVYWMSDANVNIIMSADSVMANAGNPETLGNSFTYTGKSGSTSNHFSSTESTNTSYNSNPGDYLTEDEITKQALQAVNYWITQNRDREYTVNVISDSLCIGSAGDLGDVGQNYLADAYGVDSGIALFNSPFTMSNNTIYRNHKSKWTDTELSAKLQGGAASLSDYDPMAINTTTGYMGSSSDNPQDKYTVRSSSNTKLTDTLVYVMSSLYGINPIMGTSMSTSSGLGRLHHRNDLDFGSGSNSVACSNTPYTNYISDSNKTDAGLTSVRLLNQNYDSNDEITYVDEQFDGYYSTFKYPGITTGFTMYSSISGDSDTLDYEYTPIADNITANGNKQAFLEFEAEDGTARVYCPMAIQNIDMVDEAPNGIYEEPVTVKGHYVLIMDSIGDAGHVYSGEIADRPTEYKAIYNNSSTGVNPIVIHNPISTEYCGIIGNNYPTYDNGNKISEQGEDARSQYADVDEQDKEPYIVVGNTFHVWVSGFGDFRDNTVPNVVTRPVDTLANGYTMLGSDTSTGLANPVGRGYTDRLNTNRWIEKRVVTFSFPVSYRDVNGNLVLAEANTEIDLSNVQCSTVGNIYGVVTGDSFMSDALLDESVDGLYHAPDSALNDFITEEDDKLLYGLDYEFTCLLTSDESMAGTVMVTSYAINHDYSDVLDIPSLAENNKTRYSGYSSSACNSVYEVDIVGRIGNLAIEDVGDFRYSELFKQSTGEWLIDGVIHRVDYKKPNVIVSTLYDILGDNAITNGHSTLSITNYLLQSADGTITDGYGKAGPQLTLPLSAIQNTVPEYRSSQMRLGYYAYLDIETIGNYYGINLNGDTINRGATSVYDDESWETYYTDVEEVNAATADWRNELELINEEITSLSVQISNLELDSISNPGNQAMNNQTIETLKQQLIPKYSEAQILKDKIAIYSEDLVMPRTQVMRITPSYILYDYDSDEFIAVDLYSGRQGAYSLYWTARDGVVTTQDTAALYVDLPNEKERRNTTAAEYAITEYTSRELGESYTTAVLEESDYIGTASEIVLDQFNRTFIGSNTLRGSWRTSNPSVLDYTIAASTLTGSGGILLNNDPSISISNTAGRWDTDLSNESYNKSSQRWYFTLGLPSSTYITYEDCGDSQGDVEESHDRLLAEHPNSTLICFANIEVVGSVWTLEYDFSQAMGGENACRFSVDENHQNIEYIGSPILDKDGNPIQETYIDYIVTDTSTDIDGDGVISDYEVSEDITEVEKTREITLDSHDVPLMLLDPWNTSADDLDTFGTH